LSEDAPTRFTSTIVQAGRGIAAMAVVFYHASSMYALPKYGGVDVWGGWGRLGLHGVDFFFVLSGFIIYTAHKNDIGRPENLKRYTLKRLIRIYPVYWIFLTGFLLLAAAGLGTADVAASPIDLLSSYSLIRLSPEKPPLWVAWTLFHEVIFYAMFAVLIYSRRLGVALLAAWLFLILAMHSAQGPDRPTFLTVFYDGFNLEFFFGIAVALLVGKLTRKMSAALMVAGLALLVVVGVVDHATGIGEGMRMYTVAYGLSCAVLLAGAVGLEMTGFWRSRGVMQMVGAATFSLYLAHSMVLSILYRFGAKAFPPGSPLAPVIVGGIAVVVGASLYWIVEKPVLKFFNKRVFSRA
jgi:exopolysaccharide production protein ExoZ